MEEFQSSPPAPEAPELASATPIVSAAPSAPKCVNDSQSFWQSFGFVDVICNDTTGLTGKLPDDVVAYAADTEAGSKALISIIKPLHGPPVHLVASGHNQYVYRVSDRSSLPTASGLPAGVSLLRAGESFTFQPAKASSLNNFTARRSWDCRSWMLHQGNP